MSSQTCMCNAIFFLVESHRNKTVEFESFCPPTINLTVRYKGVRYFHCLFGIIIVLVEKGSRIKISDELGFD